eukprot:gnl/TRDRNA2_/TRDRNA2_91363_c0_seq1.p1 gnl/TRDRNA2_/TRDRNA2_91363_c0~~gnl/TRDRNA2_/TRDRNA2_91363_c0_seq1.p1  ORF type:complete len:210 (+),score=25.03 gnl/TRDRNA2_/TRDRNA2_91363_c0_seq1:55-684(+)
MAPVPEFCHCLSDTQRSLVRSHTVPVFCTCGLDMEDGSMEVALNRMREEAELDVLTRLKVSEFQQQCPPTRKRRKAAKAKLVTSRFEVLDADTLLLEEAISQNSADCASHGPVDNGQSCPQEDEWARGVRERFRAARAMHRSDWKPRFQVGERVECSCNGGWRKAVVVQVRYREPEWGKGRIAAYQCRLDDGDLIFAPLDHDSVVRKIQ